MLGHAQNMLGHAQNMLVHAQNMLGHALLKTLNPGLNQTKLNLK